MNAASQVTAVVLAGGESRRFGRDKIAASVGGLPMLDRVLEGLPAPWEVLCVGPERPTRRRVTWVREEPPGGGPLAGVAAAVGTVQGVVGAIDAPTDPDDDHDSNDDSDNDHDLADDPVVVVVAGDMPWSGPVTPTLVRALHDHPGTAAAVAVDDEGQTNPLLAAYRLSALAAHLPHPAHGRRAKLLLELDHVTVRIRGRAAWDVDTPEDLTRVISR